MVISRRKLTTWIPCVVIPLTVLTVSLQFYMSPLMSNKFELYLSGHTTFEEHNVSSVPCVNDFLESIEPTVSFKPFCDTTWNQSDIICKQFLYQHGLALKDNCVFPSDNNLVPRLVYYVIFSLNPGKPPEFQFMHYLSVLSAKRYISPWAIYVISDSPPSGYWWMRVLSDIRGVRHVFRQLPYLTPGKLVFIQHASDIVRLQTLIVNGGIYLDTDMLLLQPIDVLLNTSLSMGLLDNGTGMGNAFIVAERQNPLLMEWYQGYRNFNKTSLFANSLLTAKRLWLNNPRAINEIASRIYRPNWFESEKMFKQAGYDYSSQLGVHIWHRHGHVPTNQLEMDSLNTTLGEIFSDDKMASLYRITALGHIAGGMLLGVTTSIIVCLFGIPQGSGPSSLRFNQRPSQFELTRAKWQQLRRTFIHKHGYDKDNTTIADGISKRVKVLCFVVLSHSQVANKRLVYRQTWGKRCDRLLLFTNTSIEGDKETIILNVPGTVYPIEDESEPSFKALEYIYLNNLQEAEWFIRLHPMSFVIMENLRYFLAGEDSSNPVYFGQVIKEHNILCPFGAAGYVISKEAIRKFGTSWKGVSSCKSMDASEFIVIAKCFARLGISLGDSRDVMNRSRFHGIPVQTIAVHDYADWFRQQDMNNDMTKQGISSVSDVAVTFGPVSDTIMMGLEYYIYHARVYGSRWSVTSLNRKHTSNVNG